MVKTCLPYGVVMFIITYKKQKLQKFPGTKAYWENRYATGGNSGGGSYNRLAEFKAEILNSFVKTNGIKSIIEFGCGDGNQLSLADYPAYTGFDISDAAITLCKNKFRDDHSKTFFSMNEYNRSFKAELVLSLEVVFLLIEDTVFKEYMSRLFQTSTKFVIIYACNFDGKQNQHLKPRDFVKYIQKKIKGWDLIKHIPNKYPYKNPSDSNYPYEVYDPNYSWSDFYIYSKQE
jgi:hypothetical protein